MQSYEEDYEVQRPGRATFLGDDAHRSRYGAGNQTRSPDVQRGGVVPLAGRRSQRSSVWN